MSELMMEPGSKWKNTQQSKNLYSTLQNYLPGESFSAVPVKYEHSLYINPTLPY
jgi:hypothetical protein